MKKTLLIIAFAIPYLLMAQSSGVFVSNIKLQNKAEKWCWSITQDNNLNMLFGVERGVIVYDGVNQSLIKTPTTPLALLNDSTNQKIWVAGVEDIGVLEKSNFNQYFFKKIDSRPDNDFTRIHQFNDTVYFISDSLIVRYNALTLEKIDEYSTAGFIIDEVLNYKGKLFFVIEYFLNTIRDNELIELTDSDFPVDEFTYGVSVNENTIILGTNEKTTYSYNGKSFNQFELRSPFFENNRVTNGYYYNDSTIIISSLAGGIALIDYKKRKVIKQISYFNGLPDDEIRTAFIDKEKGIWVSHEFGISRIDLQQGIENYSYYPGLKGNPIALNYFNNNLYVATNDGLFILDEIKDYNEFRVKVNVPVNVSVEIPIENEPKEDFETKEEDTKQGFFRFRKNRNKEPEVKTTKEKPKATTRKQTKVVHKVKTIKKRSLKSISHYFNLIEGMSGKYSQMVPCNDFLLVAGNNGLFSIKGKKAEAVLKNRYIVSIYKPKNGSEIYCCTNNGLYKISRKRNAWEIDHFAQTTSTKINAIAQDTDGSWIIAYENIVLRANLVDNKIKLIHEIELSENPGQTLTLKNINDSIYVFTSNKLYHFTQQGELNLKDEFNIDNYIIQNQNGFTWLFNNGAWKLFSDEKTQKSSSNLSKLTLFGNIRCIEVSPENEYWLINDKNQLYKINQRAINSFDEFNISLLTIQSNSNNLLLEKNIELNSGQNNLSITCSAPFYVLQNGVSYSYIIEGLNSKWSDWTPFSKINLGYIPAGNYTLKYRAKNILGTESKIKTLGIEVPKPFTQTVLFYILLIIVILVLAYIFFKIRLQKLEKDKQILELKVKQRTATIEKQKSRIEKQHDEITSSIRYAKRIQTAMLPHDEIIEAMLPKHFILFNPRDIVSGDFYFFKPLGDKIIFVAADCTGHGVPGGFMSMLGISFLSEITSQLPAPSASEIIDHLRDKIKLTLGQMDIDSTQKDGMDLAICVIDTDKKQIQYSGAFNPLFIIRDGILDVVKADRQPVAVYIKESIFTNHIIDVQPNDQFYMFSDGYPDQIGGPTQKKYMTKNFKKILLENHKLPMPEQKILLQKSLDEWKGDSMQVDDILVVGFKL